MTARGIVTFFFTSERLTSCLFVICTLFIVTASDMSTGGKHIQPWDSCVQSTLLLCHLTILCEFPLLLRHSHTCAAFCSRVTPKFSSEPFEFVLRISRRQSNDGLYELVNNSETIVRHCDRGVCVWRRPALDCRLKQPSNNVSQQSAKKEKVWWNHWE